VVTISNNFIYGVHDTLLSSLEKGVNDIALEDTLFIVLYWTGPVGLGIFFAGLGYLIKCVGKVARKENGEKEAKG
jgi:hypothetical protein